MTRTQRQKAMLIAVIASSLLGPATYAQSFPYFSIKAGSERYAIYDCQQIGGGYFATYYVDFTRQQAELNPPPGPQAKRSVREIKRMNEGGFNYVDYSGGEPLIRTSVRKRQGAGLGIYDWTVKIEDRAINYIRIVSGTCTGYGRPERPQEAEML